MALLTYWSLEKYEHLAPVRSAKAALTKQMSAMMMNQWHAHGHICENCTFLLHSLTPVSVSFHVLTHSSLRCCWFLLFSAPRYADGPHKDTADCTGTTFYHWGALSGLTALLEEGTW